MKHTGKVSGINSLSSALDGGYWVLKAALGSVAVCSKIFSATLPIGCDCGREYTDSAAKSHVSTAVDFHGDPIFQMQDPEGQTNRYGKQKVSASATLCFKLSDEDQKAQYSFTVIEGECRVG